jgi:hypothetical protein
VVNSILSLETLWSLLLVCTFLILCIVLKCLGELFFVLQRRLLVFRWPGNWNPRRSSGSIACNWYHGGCGLHCEYDLNAFLRVLDVVARKRLLLLFMCRFCSYCFFLFLSLVWISISERYWYHQGFVLGTIRVTFRLSCSSADHIYYEITVVLEF